MSGAGLGGEPVATVDGPLLPPGTVIDLDNCAREPIHIPGSIQPRGVLLVVREPSLTIEQASANLPHLLDVAVADALGRTIEDVFGPGAGGLIGRVTTAFGDLRERNPVEVELDVRGRRILFDAILHRDEGSLLVEFEPAEGPRPFSFPNTYQAARSAVAELNRAVSLSELYDVAAHSVRAMTGFDRVMIYRYDHEYNGEVVSEAKREDLNSFLGQHYPASDIPAQARALYEKNWIRLISDIDYTPVPLLGDPDGPPQDLTFSTLRSVSPIHVEYLQNMGVRASMSISLLRDGKLWGLIACHHYAGPHIPPYGVRAAAEFLGSALSLRLIDQADEDELRVRLAAQAALAKLTAGTMSESETLVDSLFGIPDLFDLVNADGAGAFIQGRWRSSGTVPSDEVLRAIATWARESGDDVIATDCLATSLPEVDVDPAECAGALVVTLPDGQVVMWLRREYRRTVDWGGDPHNKAIARREGSDVRLSPRKSFERWREVVRGRSVAWVASDRDVAGGLRHHLVESLYARMRTEVRLVETLQRSLLPAMPALPGWHVSAHYEPAAGGRIGGDWYDAFPLRDDSFAVVLGDVAGHGIGAAGIMAQLRNALRAYLVDGSPPEDAVGRLNDFAVETLPGCFATLVVVRVDRTTGAARIVVAGHPRPFLVAADAGTPPAGAPASTSPPIGVRGARYSGRDLDLLPGAGLVLYSDGIVERRGEDIDVSLDRFGALLATQPERAGAAVIFESIARATITDDATVLALYRDR